MSLFKGRDDVYAKRWDSKRKGTAGYSPVCLNEWKRGVCGKPKVACSACVNKLYAPMDEVAVDNHLRGTLVAGIYPMLRDETCCFLAIDFDDGNWQKDISTLQDVCVTLGKPRRLRAVRAARPSEIGVSIFVIINISLSGSTVMLLPYGKYFARCM